MNKNKENFSGRFAAIAAMAGSAIGLGNIWRFPFVAGEQGGGTFVLIYILTTIVFSLPIFITDVVIGRRSGVNACHAMEKLSGGNKVWKMLGLLPVIVPLIITCYYSVVGGWIVSFLAKSLSFDFTATSPEAITGVFNELIGSTWQPLFYHLVFLGICAIIVSMGVKSGIEKFSKYTIPALFVMVMIILFYSISLPGAGSGIRYMTRFDPSTLTLKTVAYAMGQSFYSLSLGMGVVITYGAYVRKKDNILSLSFGTAVSDLLFAVIAGLAIMPAVFAAGIAPGAGPGLIFQSIPYVFASMGQQMPIISGIVAIIFFFSVLIAAITSCMSLFEVGVAYVVEASHLSRKKASSLLFVIIGGIGILCSLSFGPLAGIQIAGMNLFDLFDWVCSNILLIAAAFISVIFAGWFMKKEDFRDEFTNGLSLRQNDRIFNTIYAIVRYIAPVAILAIFLSNFIL